MRGGRWATAFNVLRILLEGDLAVQLLLIVALLFALAVAVFAVQNAEYIVVQLFNLEFETSLVVVVLAAAAAGALSAGIIGFVRQIKSSLRIRQLQSQVNKLERHVHDLEQLLPGPETEATSERRSVGPVETPL